MDYSSLQHASDQWEPEELGRLFLLLFWLLLAMQMLCPDLSHPVHLPTMFSCTSLAFWAFLYKMGTSSCILCLGSSERQYCCDKCSWGLLVSRLPRQATLAYLYFWLRNFRRFFPIELLVCDFSNFQGPLSFSFYTVLLGLARLSINTSKVRSKLFNTWQHYLGFVNCLELSQAMAS